MKTIHFTCAVLSCFAALVASAQQIPIGAKVYAGSDGAKVREAAGGAVLYTVFAYTVGTIKSEVVAGVPISGSGSPTPYNWHLLDWDWPEDTRNGYSATVAFVYRAPLAPAPSSPGTEDEGRPEILTSPRVTLTWGSPNEFEASLTTDYLLNVRDLDAPGQPVSNYPTRNTAYTLILTTGHAYRWNVFARNGDKESGVSGTLFFNVAPVQHTVIPTARLGGTIVPSEPQLVDANEDVSFTAIADEGYEVNEWEVDGQSAQIGGTSYLLENVTANREIEVSFQLKAYRLEIGGGTEGIEVYLNDIFTPISHLTAIPYGTRVRITKTLLWNQVIDYWELATDSDFQRLFGTAVTTAMYSDVTLNPSVRTLNPSPHVSVRVDSPGTVNLTVPNPGTESSEVVKLIDQSDDLVCWRTLDIDSDAIQLNCELQPNRSECKAFFRTRFEARFRASPVLIFPVPGYSSFTVPVSAILDHCNGDAIREFDPNGNPLSDWYGIIGAYNPDALITTYKGEVLSEAKGNAIMTACDGNANLPCALLTKPLARSLDFNIEQDEGAKIPYSGHPGYDFRVAKWTAPPGLYECKDRIYQDVYVVACEAGTIVPNLSGWYENRIFIEHEHLGLATSYLHLKKWSDRLLERQDYDGKKFFYANPVSVKKGEIIGLVGGAGWNRARNEMDQNVFCHHLHLEVYKIIKFQKNGREEKRYVLIDPYGAWSESGKQIYGSLWQSGSTPMPETIPTFAP